MHELSIEPNLTSNFPTLHRLVQLYIHCEYTLEIYEDTNRILRARHDCQRKLKKQIN